MRLDSSTKYGSYGSIPSIDLDSADYDLPHYDEEILGPSNPSFLDQSNKRWSVLDKLDRRYYCRNRSCRDCARNLSAKCLLATTMLVIFLALILFFTRAIFYNSDLSPLHFDFIIVGAGPAGSIVSRRLVDAGARVLLIEAGGSTHSSLGGGDYFAAPISRFDIPFLWSTLTSDLSLNQVSSSHGNGHAPVGVRSSSAYSNSISKTTGSKTSSTMSSSSSSGNNVFNWGDFNVPGVIAGRGLGGSEVLGAMIEVEPAAADVDSWRVTGWTSQRFQQAYRDMSAWGLAPSSMHYSSKTGEGSGVEYDLQSSERYVQVQSEHGISAVAGDGVGDVSTSGAIEAKAAPNSNSSASAPPDDETTDLPHYPMPEADAVELASALRYMGDAVDQLADAFVQAAAAAGVGFTGFFTGSTASDNVYVSSVSSVSSAPHGTATTTTAGELRNNAKVARADCSPQQERGWAGFFFTEIYRGQRLSAAKALLTGYFQGSKGYSNLHIERHAVVTKILLKKLHSGGGGGGGDDGNYAGGAASEVSVEANPEPFGKETSREGVTHSSGAHESSKRTRAIDVDDDSEPCKYRAVGVEYVLSSGEVKRVYLGKGPFNTQAGLTALQTKVAARYRAFEGMRSVVLTAGALMTPKILMNSGIGQKGVLHQAGIDEKVGHKMVGRNLQNHVSVGITYELGAELSEGKELNVVRLQSEERR